MINKEQLDHRYNHFFGLGNAKDLASDHKRPSDLSDARLFAELDDLIEILSQTSNIEYISLKQTKPGQALESILRELKTRLRVRNHSLAQEYIEDLKEIASLKKTDPAKAREVADALAADLADEWQVDQGQIAERIFNDPTTDTINNIVNDYVVYDEME